MLRDDILSENDLTVLLVGLGGGGLPTFIHQFFPSVSLFLSESFIPSLNSINYIGNHNTVHKYQISTIVSTS